MCEVQIIRKFNTGNHPMNEQDVGAFLKLLELGSYGNADAYGLFGDRYMTRKGIAFYDEKEPRVRQITKNILKSKTPFLVGHNRLTTQGDESKNFNNHPFPTKDWVIVHNGVLSNDTELCRKHNLEYKEETDSAIIVNLLQMYYDNGNTSVECIRQTAEELRGRFSVCAYNKTEDRLFYFKCSGTSFSFRLYMFDDGSEVLVGSTSDSNFDHIYVDNHMIFYKAQYQDYMETEAYDETIYEITDTDIIVIGSFKHTKIQSYGTTYGSGSYGSSNTPTTRRSWETNGGVYDDDWKDYSDWQSNTAKDLSDGENIVPLKEIDFRRNIETLAQEVIDEFDDSTGLDWEYEIDWRNKNVAITTNDAPISIGELCSTFTNQFAIIPKQSSRTNKQAEILVSFQDMIEVLQ